MTQSSINSNRTDVVESGLVHANLSVGPTAVEAKVGTTRASSRQILFIYNNSTVNIYWGGPSVTSSGSTMGIPIGPKNIAILPEGDFAVYLCADQANSSAIVMEAS